jgi:Tol biopolymer transport system component
MKLKQIARYSVLMAALVILVSLLAACDSDNYLPAVTSTPSTTTQPPAATPTNVPTTATIAPVAIPTTVLATTAPVATSTSVPATTAPVVTATPLPPTATPQPIPTSQPATVAPVATAKPYKIPGKIVYGSEFDIFLINPDGTGRTKVTEGLSPSFSPDGNRIAFVTRDQTTIASVKLDGTDYKNHCYTNDLISRVVRWSPSGRFLAVYSREKLAGVSLGWMQLCDVTGNSGKLMQNITRSQGQVVFPYDWTSDGQNSLWEAGKPTNGARNFDLFYGETEKGGEGAVTLTAREYQTETQVAFLYLAARFSPSNRTVAIVGDKIFFVSTPGQTSKLDGQRLDQFEWPRGVAWSPDSEYLLVSARYRGEAGLFLYHFDSGQITKLVSNYYEGNIDWTRN